MSLDTYDYFASPGYLEYRFISEGPKGRITKVVRYTKFVSEWGTFFNLGFGDENEETGAVNDLTISNNDDRDKILATVASTVLDFIEKYPNTPIIIVGSSASRTRLYQMGISGNLAYLKTLFHIVGIKNNELEMFKKNVNYESFLVIPK